MPVREIIGKGLEKWAEKQESRDEEFAAVVLRNMEALSNRRTLKIYIAGLASINLVLWLCVILFSRAVEEARGKVSDLDDKIAITVIVIIFGVGFWLSYALFRLWFPDIEEQNLENQFLSGFHFSQHSVKRFRIWTASVAGGVVNVLALIIIEIYMSHGW